MLSTFNFCVRSLKCGYSTLTMMLFKINLALKCEWIAQIFLVVMWKTLLCLCWIYLGCNQKKVGRNGLNTKHNYYNQQVNICINTRTFSHSDSVHAIMSNYLLAYLVKSNLQVMKDQLVLISLSMSSLVVILAILTITKTHPQLSRNFVSSKVSRAIPPT